MIRLLNAIVGIPIALAQSPCIGVTNCGIGVNPMIKIVEDAAAFLLPGSAGLTMLFTIVGGATMVMNFGNDTNIEKGKKGIYFALIGWAITLGSQAIVSFAVARASIVDPNNVVFDFERTIVMSMLYVFNSVFALMMIFYGFKLVLGRGEQAELDSAKKGIRWTVVGAITINLSYALVRATTNLGF